MKASGWIVVVAFATTLCAQANLLLNPSVETATDWTYAGSVERAGTSSWGLPIGSYPDGEYGIKLWYEDANFYQADILVTPEVEYTVSGYFYHSATQDAIDSSADSLRAFMRIEWFNSLGGSLRNDYTANHNGTLTADAWLQISTTFTAPADAHHATFHVQADRNDGGGSIHGDMFNFAVVPEPGTLSLGLIGGVVGVLLGARRLRCRND